MARGVKKVIRLKEMPLMQLLDECKKRKAIVEQHEHNVNRLKKEMKEARQDLINSKLRMNYAVSWLRSRAENE